MLKGFNANGYHFRRQVPIGPYFADFACHHPKLVIELDGDTHGTEEAVAYDKRRDAFLNRRGYEVLRIGNRHLHESPDGVWEVVKQTLSRLTPTPNPSPQGGGESDRAMPRFKPVKGEV